MATNLFVPAIDYTDRDYAAIRDRLRSLIPSYTPDWTDNNNDDLGVVLLQLWAYVGDILHYYVDRNLSEAFVSTAVTQESLNNIWKLIDYTPIGTTPSSVILTFTTPSAVTGNTTIPAGTVCQTATSGDIISFETDEDAVIAAGQSSVSVLATQGITKATISSLESIGTSDGTVFQKFKIPNQPTIDSSIRVFVDEGSSNYIEYFRVTNFDTSTADDRVFKLLKDEDNFSWIFFGDSNTGKTPPNGSDIGVAYRVGGGVAGNVGANSVTVVSSSLGFTVAVTNPSEATGGSSPDSLKAQKEKGPLSLKALNRAVTLDDYRSLAMLVEGVYDAYVYYQENSATAVLAVAPTGGGLPSTDLKSAIQTEIDAKNSLGTEVEVVDPDIVAIDFEAVVTLTNSASQSIVSTEVDSEVAAFLSFGDEDSGSNFGTDVFLSDITSLIDNIDGVDHVDVRKLTRVSVADLTNFNDQGATITMTTGSKNTVEQVITVTMDSDAAQQYDIDQTADYIVTGSISGLLGAGTAKTTNPSAFSIDSNGVNFTVNVDLSVNSNVSPYDKFTFTVGKYLGNQTIQDDEIADDGTITITYLGGTT